VRQVWPVSPPARKGSYGFCYTVEAVGLRDYNIDADRSSLLARNVGEEGKRQQAAAMDPID